MYHVIVLVGILIMLMVYYDAAIGMAVRPLLYYMLCGSCYDMICFATQQLLCYVDVMLCYDAMTQSMEQCNATIPGYCTRLSYAKAMICYTMLCHANNI